MSAPLTITEKRGLVALRRRQYPFFWAMRIIKRSRRHEFDRRLLEAVRTQGRDTMHDPIEDAPAMQAVFKQVEDELEVRFGNGPHELGFCHRYWREKKRLLRERHGVDWYTPAEMNWSTRFD